MIADDALDDQPRAQIEISATDSAVTKIIGRVANAAIVADDDQFAIARRQACADFHRVRLRWGEEHRCDEPGAHQLPPVGRTKQTISRVTFDGEMMAGPSWR